MSLVPFHRTAGDACVALFELGIYLGSGTPCLRFSEFDYSDQRIAIVNVITGRPQMNPPGTVVDINPTLVEEVRARVAARRLAAGGRIDRTDNDVGYNDPGYARHALDESFLREHVWKGPLEPFSVEPDLVYIETADLPSWIKNLPAEARAREDLYSPPDAVVGLRLTPKQQDAIRAMHINVATDFAPSSPPSDPVDFSAELDPTFLPLMVCFSRANLKHPRINHPRMKLPPPPSSFADTACLSAYSSMVAYRKIQEHARKMAESIGQKVPISPPLIVASFSDTYLVLTSLDAVVDEDELAKNRGKPYRNLLISAMYVPQNNEEHPLLNVLGHRQFAAEQLRLYLDAIASL